MSIEDTNEKAFPNVGEGRRGLEGYLLYLLRQASTASHQAIDRILAAQNLSLAQYSALTMINSYKNLSSAQLARLSMLTPQSTHEVVQRLTSRGLISKFRSEFNRKVYILQITDEGKLLLKEARHLTDPIESLLQSEASMLDEAVIRKWLVAVARKLET